MASDMGKALNLSDNVINNLKPKTGKSEYINALAHPKYWWSISSMRIIAIGH